MATEQPATSLRRLGWIHLAPALHVCLLVLGWTGLPWFRWLQSDVVSMIFNATEFPVALGAMMLAWAHPVLTYMWLLVAGAIWWYLVGLVVRFLWTGFRPSQDQTP